MIVYVTPGFTAKVTTSRGGLTAHVGYTPSRPKLRVVR